MFVLCNLLITKHVLSNFSCQKHPNLNKQQPDMLKEKLCENEKLMKEMSLTWEEKLFKTGKFN